MIVTKVIDIKNKILRDEDVINFAKIVEKEYKSLLKLKSKRYTEFKIDIFCSDKSEYKFNSVSEFSNGNKFTTSLKRVKEVNITFCNYGYDKQIEIRLKNDDSYLLFERNYIAIKSKDESWANSLQVKFEELVKSLTPQPYFSGFIQVVGQVIIALLIGLPTMIAMRYVISHKDITSIFLKLNLFDILAIMPFGMIIGSYFVYRIVKLYPLVELQLGPEHLLYEKQKRKLLFFIIIQIFLPLFITIIFWLIPNPLYKK